MDKWELKEKHVSQQVRDFLEWHGWRIVRNNVTKLQDRTGRWISFGEPGMPDFLCLYYCDAERAGVALVLWVEVKKENKKPRPHQEAWHAAEEARGGCVVVADHLDTFKDWYWSNFQWLHNSRGKQSCLFPE